MSWFNEAENGLGWMYHNGLGVARDTAEAIRWYERAAAKGLKLAEGNLFVLKIQSKVEGGES